MHGLDVLQLRTGSDMLLVGIGPTGLILAQLLRAAGAGRATVAGRTPFEPEPEPEPEPELAAAYGADGTVRLTGLTAGCAPTAGDAPDRPRRVRHGDHAVAHDSRCLKAVIEP